MERQTDDPQELTLMVNLRFHGSSVRRQNGTDPAIFDVTPAPVFVSSFDLIAIIHSTQGRNTG